MNWSAISAVADVVAAIAVVVSLVYLASQIRSGIRALRTTMRDNVFHSLQEWNYVVASDQELPAIFQRGAADFDSLDEKERARFVHIMFSFFKLFENIYLHNREGSVGEEAWTQNKMFLSLYVNQPGCRHYWENRKAAYDSRFREMVDRMGKAPIPPAHSLSRVAGES